MKPNRKTLQTTVKMEPSLRDEIDQAAAELGISSMEFIRRACREKIPGGGKVSDEEIRAIVLAVLREWDPEKVVSPRSHCPCMKLIRKTTWATVNWEPSLQDVA